MKTPYQDVIDGVGAVLATVRLHWLLDVGAVLATIQLHWFLDVGAVLATLTPILARLFSIYTRKLVGTRFYRVRDLSTTIYRPQPQVNELRTRYNRVPSWRQCRKKDPQKIQGNLGITDLGAML